MGVEGRAARRIHMLIDLSVAHVDTLDVPCTGCQHLLNDIIEQSLAATFDLLGVAGFKLEMTREPSAKFR